MMRSTMLEHTSNNNNDTQKGMGFEERDCPRTGCYYAAFLFPPLYWTINFVTSNCFSHLGAWLNDASDNIGASNRLCKYDLSDVV